VVADKLNPTDSPLILVTDTIFGFAIIYSFYPNTIAIAIAFPVVAGEESKVNVPTPLVPDPETLSTFKNVPAVIFPVGNLISYDCPALWGGLVNLIPCELDSQFN
jgi:hypothetical protein